MDRESNGIRSYVRKVKDDQMKEGQVIRRSYEKGHRVFCKVSGGG